MSRVLYRLLNTPVPKLVENLFSAVDRAGGRYFSSAEGALGSAPPNGRKKEVLDIFDR